MNLQPILFSLMTAIAAQARYLRGNNVDGIASERDNGRFQSENKHPPAACLYLLNCGLNPHEYGIHKIGKCDANNDLHVSYTTLSGKQNHISLSYTGSQEMNPCSSPYTHYLRGGLFFSGNDPRWPQSAWFIQEEKKDRNQEESHLPWLT